MRALIILNGECRNCTYLFNQVKSFDTVICADGGYEHLKELNIKPDAVLGDFDSTEEPKDIETVRFPVEKDMTDAEIAIEYAKKCGADEIVLTCTLGGRVDHEMANIFLLTAYENLSIEEENCSILCINGEYTLKGCKGKTVSIIPFMKAKVTISGFKYPLDGEINTGSTLTLSNIAEEDIAKVNVTEGKCILIINHTI